MRTKTELTLEQTQQGASDEVLLMNNTNFCLAAVTQTLAAVTSRRLLIPTVDNGETTCFWIDLWVGNSPLCYSFPRLFRLESQPNCRVCDRAPTILIAALKSCYVQRGDGPHIGPQLESIGLHTSSVGPSGLPSIVFSWAWSRLPRSLADFSELLELDSLISNLQITSYRDK
ncbi:hypothetical protein Tco_0458855 [Tanacetum coccineum]